MNKATENSIESQEMRNRKRGKNLFVFHAFLCLFSVLVIGGIIMKQNNDLANINQKVAIQNREITDLQKTKTSLASKVEGIKKSDELLHQAKFKLGMVYPGEDQIVYIDVEEKTESNDVNQNVFLNPVISVLKIFPSK